MLIRQLRHYKWHFSPHSLFTKDSVMKPSEKSLVWEGEGGWLLFPSDLIMSFTLEGRGDRVMRRLPGLEGRLFSLSFLSLGFGSVSSWSLRQPICQCAVSQAFLDSLPRCWGDRTARSCAGDASLKCQVFYFRQHGAFTRGQIPSDLSLLRSFFFLVMEKRNWSERLSVFSEIKINWYVPSGPMD